MEKDKKLHLNLHSQKLGQDSNGHNYWETVITEKTLAPSQIAILICDMWNDHWSRGAAERVNAMAARMNEVIRGARAKGVKIIHAPSGTMDRYDGSPARQRAIDAPYVAPPPRLERPDPPLPIDDSDGGSDTGGESHKAWISQHLEIEIDQEKDAVSDDGIEVYNFLRQHGIEAMAIMGVHTNICVLNRTFAIKSMVRWGVDTILVRDLTDTMYNPAMSPYVSHDEGTRLVVEYIEKFWCPSTTSRDFLVS